MQTYELIAPCHFGLESVVKNEIYDLGYEITEVDDGRVSFEATWMPLSAPISRFEWQNESF